MDRIVTSFINSDHLPLVIEPVNKRISFHESMEAIREKKTFLHEELLRYGALLFRGFPVEDATLFSEFIKNFGTGRFLDYIGGDSPRNKIADGIYTSTEDPPFIKIPLHNELSFVKNHPQHIYFYCHIEPEKKGETIIGDARKIYRNICPKVKQRFGKEVKHISRYYDKSPLIEWINKIKPSHKSWRQVFETECSQEVMKKCSENEFGFKWTKNGWIELHQTRPSTKKHPKTNEIVWFNQAHLFDLNPKFLGPMRYMGIKLLYMRKHTLLHEVCFSDDTPVDRKDIYHILEVLDKNTVAFPWRKGDVLVLDNVLTMHGRETFSGKRKIMTAMTG